MALQDLQVLQDHQDHQENLDLLGQLEKWVKRDPVENLDLWVEEVKQERMDHLEV